MSSYKTFVKIENKQNETHEERDVETYGDITLKFGKYNGCRISDVINGDRQYSIWLYENSIKKNVFESPTTFAIKKYFQHFLE